MAQFQTQTQVQQSRDDAQFQLRLPEDLKERISAEAKATGRSMNSEIVAALLKQFPHIEPRAKATADVLQYIRQAPDDLEQSTRVAEVSKALMLADRSITVTVADDGSVSITLKG